MKIFEKQWSLASTLLMCQSICKNLTQNPGIIAYASNISNSCYFYDNSTSAKQDWSNSMQSCSNIGSDFGVMGRLAWLNTLSIWNDLNGTFFNNPAFKLSAWIGLKSKYGLSTRPDMYWTDNSSVAAMQMTFGTDSFSSGVLNIGGPLANSCVKFKATAPNPEWDTEDCSKKHPSVCELVCDNSATQQGKISEENVLYYIIVTRIRHSKIHFF